MSGATFVYTYGRVGSTAVFNSIKRHTDSHHFHNIVPHFRSLNYSPEEMSDLIARKDTRVITGVRNPLSRTVSAFFTWMTKRGSRDSNNYGQYAGYGRYFVGEDLEEIKKAKVSDLIGVFTRCLLEDDIFSPEGCWFDNNIRKYFGVNLYEHEFDKEKNYAVIEDRILVYKQERLADYGEDILRSFLGVDCIKLERHNSCNFDGETAERFRSELRIGEDVLDRLFDNFKIRHFYGQDEIDRAKRVFLD